MLGLPSNPSEPSLQRRVPIIALDGPSGVGKGTVAQALVKRLGWHYLESGALYRVLGLLAQRAGIGLDDSLWLARRATNLALEFRDGKVFLDDEDIDSQVRSEAAGVRASKLAVLPEVRSALHRWQRGCARMPGLVADGRDMGTVVFPEAQCKIFISASPQVRANRRFQQLKARGFNVVMADLVREISERDQRDRERSISPLKVADDAWELDTSDLSVAQVMAAVERQVRATLSV